MPVMKMKNWETVGGLRWLDTGNFHHSCSTADRREFRIEVRIRDGRAWYYVWNTKTGKTVEDETDFHKIPGNEDESFSFRDVQKFLGEKYPARKPKPKVPHYKIRFVKHPTKSTFRHYDVYVNNEKFGHISGTLCDGDWWHDFYCEHEQIRDHDREIISPSRTMLTMKRHIREWVSKHWEELK